MTTKFFYLKKNPANVHISRHKKMGIISKINGRLNIGHYPKMLLPLGNYKIIVTTILIFRPQIQVFIPKRRGLFRSSTWGPTDLKTIFTCLIPKAELIGTSMRGPIFWGRFFLNYYNFDFHPLPSTTHSKMPSLLDVWVSGWVVGWVDVFTFSNFFGKKLVFFLSFF